jgi:hypothetical protein
VAELFHVEHTPGPVDADAVAPGYRRRTTELPTWW